MGRRRRARSYSEAQQRVDALQAQGGGQGMDPDGLKKWSEALEESTKQLGEFKKQADESAKAWGKSFAGMTGVSSLLQGAENSVANWGNQFAPGNLQGLAGGMSSGLGGYVGAVREGLGDVDAAGGAAARLGGMGAHFAREGMPLDPQFMRQIAPMIQEQEREAQKAQRFANDIVGESESSRLGDALYDAYGQMRRMLGLDAAKQRR